MVAKALMFTLLLVPMALWAQKYSVEDTVTEYPHKGTYYHNKFEGRKTANGEIFDQNLFTAAHRTIKMGTYVMVTNQNTGLQVIVRVNDRCPKRGVFDMSHRAANSIGIKGCQPVKIRILPETEEYIARWEAQDAQFDSVYSKFGGPKPEPKPQTKPKPKKKKDKTAPTIPIIVDSPQTSASAPRYNLILCTADSHGNAYERIQKLPQYYRDVAIVDSTDPTELHITLEVKLTKKSAAELQRALKKDFPECKIAPVE